MFHTFGHPPQIYRMARMDRTCMHRTSTCVHRTHVFDECFPLLGTRPLMACVHRTPTRKACVNRTPDFDKCFTLLDTRPLILTNVSHFRTPDL